MQKKIEINPEAFVLDPLKPEEIDSIEIIIGRSVPPVLRALIGKVGFLQNAIGGDWPQSKNEFIEIQNCIPQDHVAFLGDGTGNYHVVSAENGLLFWDHEIGKLSEEKSTFEEFVSQLLLDPEPIEEIGWHIQMAFKVNQDKDVIDALSDSFGFELAGPWEFKNTSPAGVWTYIRMLLDAGKTIIISKQTYKGWNFDLIYCNRIVEVNDIAKHRLMFQEFETDPSLGFTLVDYGILPLNLDESGSI